MSFKVVVEKNAYFDSVTLMSLSGEIGNKDGVELAIVSMASQMNKEFLENIGMLTEQAKNAGENDLIIAIKASSEALIDELIAHNFQNRTIAVIENGTWTSTSGSLMRSKLEKAKNIAMLEHSVCIKSSLKEENLLQIEAMADEIAVSISTL